MSKILMNWILLLKMHKANNFRYSFSQVWGIYEKKV